MPLRLYCGPILPPGDGQISANALDVIASAAPALTESEAQQLLAERYDVSAELAPLVSERDQNFDVRSGDGRRFVLKIANSAEDRQVTEFQILALLHIERESHRFADPLPAPRIVHTVNGEPGFVLQHDGEENMVRLVSWVEGDIQHAHPLTPALSRDLGRRLAELGQMLAGYRHPGESQPLMWDMKRALELRPLLKYVSDATVHRQIEDTLNDFEQIVVPRLGALRWQVAHCDFHPGNIVLDSDNPERVAGVIDFGDMLYSPLIFDVSVGASYLRTDDEDPLALVIDFVGAYHEVEPLTSEELELVYHLIRARLAASVCIPRWRAGLGREDDAYGEEAMDDLQNVESFLALLDQMSPDEMASRLRERCGR